MYNRIILKNKYSFRISDDDIMKGTRFFIKSIKKHLKINYITEDLIIEFINQVNYYHKFDIEMYDEEYQDEIDAICIYSSSFKRY